MMTEKTSITINDATSIANEFLKSNAKYIEGMEFKSAKLVGGDVIFDGEIFHNNGEPTENTSLAILVYGEVIEDLLKIYKVI